MMTKDEMIQDLFNKMWRGLSGQNWQPAFEELAGCRYRMPDGRKCAVGHCIPDDMYSESIEGLPACSIPLLDELGWDKWEKVMYFLEDAQDAHDSGGRLQRKFERLATKYRLTIPDTEAV